MELRGIPAPYPLAFGDNFFSRFLLKLNTWLTKISIGFFSYQIGIIAEPKPTLEYLLLSAEKTGREKANAHQ